METMKISDTKISEFGECYEKIRFFNGLWYDVEKESYIMVKFYKEGEWYMLRKDNEFIKTNL